MKFISIERKTILENRFTPEMGLLYTPVTYIRKKVLGIPFETLHKYRQTYYGEVKDCSECQLHK